MSYINSLSLEGNLVQDPQIKKTANGLSVCEFSIAHNSFHKQGEEMKKSVSFFNVTTFGKLANECGAQLSKGQGVRLVGQLKQSRWKDQEGNNRQKIYIVADQVEWRTLTKQQSAENQAVQGNGQSNAENEMGY